MESNPESSKTSPPPPSTKRQKTLSDKDGGQSDASLESSQASTQAPAKNIKTFVVQCSRCKKWRLVPTKTKYEAIRENILDEPFLCEKAREWESDMACNDPSDFSQQDDTKVWAIDKPNIP